MTLGWTPAARRALMAWYRASGRHELPWRTTRDPYAVLVSEVMLQQTQVERVIPYWERWLARWPYVRSLAAASPAEAIQEWSGLGYNRRALNLHRAAVAVVERHGGTVPGDSTALQALPGVGEYTAAAVASFAGEQPVAVVDTNIGRVMARVVVGVEQGAVSALTARQAAIEALPEGGVRDWNLGLMDLGAMVCRKRAPGCDGCPVRRWCTWHAAGRPASERTVAAAVRFEATARYARGRIVDALRDGPHGVAELAEAVGDGHRERLGQYLAALAREGMIEAAGGGWRLPGDERAVRAG